MGRARSVERGNDESIDDLRAFGASDELIDKIEQQQDVDDEFEVWPDLIPVIRLFVAVGTQWRVGGMGGYIGLDYSAVDVVINRLGLAVDSECFIGLQVMERAVIGELNRVD